MKVPLIALMWPQETHWCHRACEYRINSHSELASTLWEATQHVVGDLEHDGWAVLLDLDGGPSALKPATGVVDESWLRRVW